MGFIKNDIGVYTPTASTFISEKDDRYVTLKDKSVYEKMKCDSVIHRLMYFTKTHVAVELELLDKNSNWIITMPFEHTIKEWESEIANGNNVEKHKDNLAFYAKYRKWQKRKLYTREEFEELFEEQLN